MHRLAAADNSITSLRFDHRRILTGASDGRVKVWDLRTGELIRELGQPADAVWKVHLEETLAVTIRTTQSSGPKIVIEVGVCYFPHLWQLERKLIRARSGHFWMMWKRIICPLWKEAIPGDEDSTSPS